MTSFLLHYLAYLNQQKQVLIYPKSNLSSLLFKLLKLVGTFFNLSISYLSILDFKLAKSTFFSKF